MTELKITDRKERMLILNALISHCRECKEIIKLHNESKGALGPNAITATAEVASEEMQLALNMIAKYYGVHLGDSKFYCLDCAPTEGPEHDRMTEGAAFMRSYQCNSCLSPAYYFVESSKPLACGGEQT